MKKIINNEMATMYSGGASGADQEWANCASAVGHKIVHYRWTGHYLNGENIITLSEDQLKEADPYLEQANSKLKRRLGSNPYVVNLLRRNFFQIKDVTKVYAIGDFQANRSETSVSIEGGTAWACQMFIDKMIATNVAFPKLYFFSQSADQWYRPMLNGTDITWEVIGSPPVPSGKYAAIGTRQLTKNGREAIQKLFM